LTASFVSLSLEMMRRIGLKTSPVDEDQAPPFISKHG
jgi:hypothetical protein